MSSDGNILKGFKLSKTDLQEAKKVLKTKRYLITFILSSLIVFALLYLVTVATNSFSLAVFIEMNGLPLTILGFALLGIAAVLFGTFASLSLYKYELANSIGEKNTATSAGGFVIALFSAGCPTCGSLLLPLIGISSLAVFPLQGFELKIASIILLGAVNIKTVKSLKSCTAREARASQPIISPGVDKAIYASIIITAALLLFNQGQIVEISSAFSLETARLKGAASIGSDTDLSLSDVDVMEINSTAMAVATLLPVSSIKSQEDAIALMISTGTPEYSAALGGISFDEPVGSMEYLAKWFPIIKEEVKQNNPEAWQRYLNLAAQPRGVSCEYCCGLGAQGAREDGESMCGCKHNPALLGLTLGLLENTDYNDAEVLREVIKWKAMFFPKNMVELAMQVAGTDPSELANLPGMVGGC